MILLDSRSLRINWTREGIKAVRHQNIVFQGLLKQIPWHMFDRLVEEHGADEGDDRRLKSKPHLIAMLYRQLYGLRSLREVETTLRSHASELYHLGGCTVSKSALATANRERPFAIFAALLSVLMKQLQAGYRRKVRDCVRLIDSTSVQLSSLNRWAMFSAGVFGAKAHIIYDPDADQPIFLMVTAANVNDITAAKQMPIEAEATYVFDLGYYDYGWWAALDQAGCRIVTRLKANTPFEVVEERTVPAGSSILSDRIGYLPKRLAASRKNPMSGLTREICVVIETGKTLRIFTNDLKASAQEIADLYKRRWAIELFFRWVKQTLKIDHFVGTSENAVRIQIAIALIAFLLLRLTHEANKIVDSPLTFARLIRANLMHRRSIPDLLQKPPPKPEWRQILFDFEEHATRAVHRRRTKRAGLLMEKAA